MKRNAPSKQLSDVPNKPSSQGMDDWICSLAVKSLHPMSSIVEVGLRDSRGECGSRAAGT